jgi:hypothetical protein
MLYTIFFINYIIHTSLDYGAFANHKPEPNVSVKCLESLAILLSFLSSLFSEMKGAPQYFFCFFIEKATSCYGSGFFGFLHIGLAMSFAFRCETINLILVGIKLLFSQFKRRFCKKKKVSVKRKKLAQKEKS